jgi:hypothetical protein
MELFPLRSSSSSCILFFLQNTQARHVVFNCAQADAVLSCLTLDENVFSRKCEKLHTISKRNTMFELVNSEINQ